MTNRVIQDISGYVATYATNAIVVAVVFSVAKFVCTLFYVRSHKDSSCIRLRRRMVISLPMDGLAMFYICMVIAITFFSRMEGSTDVVNLRLFSTFADNLQAKIFIVENVVMFVPLGVFLRWYGVRKYRIVLPIAAMTSILIELAQRISKRGMAEVDDVLTNTVGAMIGFTVIICIEVVVKRLRKNR